MLTGELVATGRTSKVFRYGRDSVVKVLRVGVPDNWAALEASLTAAVKERGVPAAEVRDMVMVDGRPGIVFQRIDGPSMWQLMLDQPDRVVALTEELAQVHRHIQQIGLPEGIPDLVDRLEAKIGEVEELTSEERDEGRAMIAGLPRGAALLHGDLHPGNVLLSADGPVVIDWFDAAIGHPVADVIRSSLLMRPWPERPSVLHLPGADQTVLGPMHAAYTSHFAAVLGAAERDLCRWESVMAAARMAEQVTSDQAMLRSLWRRRHDPDASAVLLADAAIGE